MRDLNLVLKTESHDPRSHWDCWVLMASQSNILCQDPSGEVEVALVTSTTISAGLHQLEGLS